MVPKYAKTGPKKPPLLDRALSRWLKISLQVLWKKVTTATGFIVAVVSSNVEVILLEYTNNYTCKKENNKTLKI